MLDSPTTYASPSLASPHASPQGSPGDTPPRHTPPTPAGAENTMPVRSLRGAAASRSLPASPELSSARGKGGCWTCRLRRKKCDEQRENGACQTCIRLRIECLGWGVRRPDWMRDKAQVEAYKAAIKRQLSSQGMIRGQPKPPQGDAAPPGYVYPHRDTGSDGTDEYAYEPGASAHASPSYPPIQMPQLTPDLAAGISALDLQLYGAPLPAAPLPITPPVLPAAFAPSPHVLDGELAALLPFVPHAYYEPAPAASAPSPDTREHHVLYYFRRVRPVQFLFAGGGVTSALHDLVVRDPAGVVTNAICALAALHKGCARVAEGREHPAAEHALHALAKQYYDQAWWQILDSRRRHHRHMEHDATAAVHLVGYWLFCGGGGDWEAPLAVACDWLAAGPLPAAAHPRLPWLQLGPAARITAQTTMWLDVLSAVAMRREPRFLDLYRRLFRADHPHPHPLGLAELTGCPDAVLYALAETAALAHWKAQHQQSHSLSVRELVRRADAIEHALRAACAGPQQHGPYAPPAPPSAHPSPVHPAADLATPEPVLGPDTRRLVADVFAEAALLHLQTVVHDHNTAVPEIVDGVHATMQALHKLAPADVDRGLVFPICVAGCLAEGEQRLFFSQRLDAAQRGAPFGFGNAAQTARLMDVVWRKRDEMHGAGPAHQGPQGPQHSHHAPYGGACVVDWRCAMPDIGVNLLVI